MTIGAMRERLRVLVKTQVSDGGFGQTTTWATLDTVAAEVLPLKADERLAAQQVAAEVRSRFRVRVREDWTSELRVQWRPSWRALATPLDLEVLGVYPDAMDPTRFVLLDCGEVAALAS